MTEQVLVQAGGTQFYVEVQDEGGVVSRRTDDPFDLDGVRDTIAAIAGEVAEVWQRVKPSEATVAFGLKVTAKSGKLTGLLVEAGGEASLTITLTWKAPGGDA